MVTRFADGEKLLSDCICSVPLTQISCYCLPSHLNIWLLDQVLSSVCVGLPSVQITEVPSENYSDYKN